MVFSSVAAGDRQVVLVIQPDVAGAATFEESFKTDPVVRLVLAEIIGCC
ncbi:MAG: hypothetical protein ACLRWQ_01810 [Flavonifractor plautii]